MSREHVAEDEDLPPGVEEELDWLYLLYASPELRRDAPARIRLVDALLQTHEGTPHCRSHALALRSVAHEDHGDLDRALADALASHEARGDVATFGAYVSGLRLGTLYEKRADDARAVDWLLRSLGIALDSHDGPPFPCTASLSRLDRLVSTGRAALDDRSRALVAAAMDHSWRALGLRGAPDHGDPSATLARLVRAERAQNRRARDRRPVPPEGD